MAVHVSGAAQARTQTAVHISGARLIGLDGRPLRLIGVNRSGYANLDPRYSGKPYRQAIVPVTFVTGAGAALGP